MYSFSRSLFCRYYQDALCQPRSASKQLVRGLVALTIGLSATACATVPEASEKNIAVAKEVAAPETKATEADSQIWLEANATYAEQNFSGSLYAEILEEDYYCLATGTCGDVKYLFEDVLMVATVGEFGSTKTALIPHQSISKSQALSYARMLDTDGVIDFEDSKVMDNSESDRTQPVTITESYFEAGLPAEGIAYEVASARTAQIISDQNGEIIEVSYRVDVF
ncbi:MAG: hypothetical protein AAF716_16280 [Cyanobacteria bacterium P01_D01_bin.1]